MNSYELLYIIDNDLSDEAKENLVSKIQRAVHVQQKEPARPQ